MRKRKDFEEWEDWDDDNLMEFDGSDSYDDGYPDDDFYEEDEDDDDERMFEFAQDDDETSKLADGFLNQETMEVLYRAMKSRDFRFTGKKASPGVVSSNDIITFHEFIENTVGVCRWEKDFFRRLKLYKHNN